MPVNIPGYIVSRSGRSGRLGGGALLYSHINLPISETLTFDDKVCDPVFCKFETVKKCIAIVYRPPEASVNSFSNVLSFLTESFKIVNDDSCQFCIFGDFKFPFIDWKTSFINPGGSSEFTQSANHIFAFMCEHFLNQYIFTPTRNNNILDLFLINDDSLVTNVYANKTRLSDHNLVDIMISSNPLSPDKSAVPAFNDNSLKKLTSSKLRSFRN